MKLFCRTVLRRSIFAIMLLLLLPSSVWAQEPEAVESATEAEDDEPRNEGRMGKRLRLLFKNSAQNSDANSEEAEESDDDDGRSKRKERKNRDADALTEGDSESDSSESGEDESGDSVYYEDAHLEFDETVWDFGDVARKGGDVVKVFEFVNDGSKPLLITGITMSCTCIKVDYPKRPVAAGKRGAIKLIYEPHKMSPGTFYRVVQVHSNSVDGIRLLTVSGNSVDARRLD